MAQDNGEIDVGIPDKSRAPKYHSTIRKSNDPAASMREGGGGSLLRAARSGNVEKLTTLLDQENVDISTSNSSGLTAMHLAAKEGHCSIINELLQRGAPINQTTKRGNTALHIASLAGKLAVVELLLAKGADPNSQAQNAFTPLYMASQEGHEAIVEYLLNHGANQSISTEDGFTPLAVALQENKDKVVQLLLDNDVKGRVKLPALHIAARKDDVKAAVLLLQNDNTADTTSRMMVNRTTESGFTALHIAAHYGNVNVATLLLNRGAAVDFKARNGITPMHVAAKRGNTRFCALLLDRNGRPDACTRDGLVPIHCAARSGHLPIVKLFLDCENTPKYAKTKNGLTPLHMAAQGGHADVIEVLLDKEYPVDDVTSDYLSALHIASHCGHVSVAELMLRNSAHVDCKALNGFTPLHVACKKNRIKVVELLISYKANIEAVTESGLSPLHIACFMGHEEIVQLLIKKNAQLNTVNVRGETALHMATRSGKTEIVTYLLRHGAKPDTRKQESQTCLHLAARLDKHEILKLLLKHGASVDATMEDGCTPLHVAAREGHVDICETLLANKGSVAKTTKKGFTPLHLAAKYGRLEVANLMIKNEADPDAGGKNGLTPLHVAAHYDNQQVALLLLKNGASPHASGKNGYTPLHIAAKKNQMEIAITLLEYGASPNSKTRMDVTPLHLAAQEGHVDMCSLLLAKEANVNASAKHGLSPMHLAAQEDRVSVAKILYDNKSLVDPLTKSGCTPLHVAAHHGNIKIANYLLSLEAKVNAKTKNGYTPLHQASQQGHTHVVNLLIKFGASPNDLTNSGNTALSLAKRLGYISVVDTLKTITTETTTTVTEEKRKLNVPETVNEEFMSEASDDDGDESLVGGGFLTNNEMKELGDDSIVPTEASLFAVQQDSKYSTLEVAAGFGGPRTSWSSSATNDSDNIKSPRSPRCNGFLVSFMVDARGATVRGTRHYNLRFVVPPKACRAPTRVTCRFARKRHTAAITPTNNPSLYDAEGNAARVLEVGPRGASFLEPVAIEIPHFASMKSNNRQIVVMRSNDGSNWKDHKWPCTDEQFRKQHSNDDLESSEKLAERRIFRIITSDLPRFFALVSRPLEDAKSIGASGGELTSSVVKEARAKFPEGSLTKKINVAMQVLPITPEICKRAVGGKAKASAILTIEPRRRKFHKPIQLTVPLPEGTDKKDYLSTVEDSTLRLLCSISGDDKPAQWEDITGSTPLNFLDNFVTFTSTVSARFWLIDCRQPSESSSLAHQIYAEATRVPYMAKFLVFGKTHDPLEARLRVFCLTEDRYERTLEKQENYVEIARSRDVEVYEGSKICVECSGNLSAPIKSGQVHNFEFRAFNENRIQCLAKVRDSIQEPCGRLTFTRQTLGPPKTHGARKTLCNLNITLPPCDRDLDSDEETGMHYEKTVSQTPEEEASEARKRYFLVDPASGKSSREVLEQKHHEVASQLGIHWPALAGALGLSPDDVWKVQRDVDGSTAGEQSKEMLALWLSKRDDEDKESADACLSDALRKIGREDLCPILNDPVFHYGIIDPSMNVDKEEHDSSAFHALSDELGSPYTAQGHVSSPYPFPAVSKLTMETSTPTAALKARNETLTDGDNSLIVEPPSAADDDDDVDKPHFSYVIDDTDEVDSAAPQAEESRARESSSESSSDSEGEGGDPVGEVPAVEVVVAEKVEPTERDQDDIAEDKPKLSDAEKSGDDSSDNEDDPSKPHFKYVADEDWEVLDVPEQLEEQLATEEKANNVEGRRSRSSSESSSSEDERKEVEPTKDEPTKVDEKQLAQEKSDGEEAHDAEDHRSKSSSSSSSSEDEFKDAEVAPEESKKEDKQGEKEEEKDEPQMNGQNNHVDEPEIDYSQYEAEYGVTTTTIIRTIVVETQEPNEFKLPPPKVEVDGSGDHVIEVSREVKRKVVDQSSDSD